VIIAVAEPVDMDNLWNLTERLHVDLVRHSTCLCRA
jgi:hypothetical protein